MSSRVTTAFLKEMGTEAVFKEALLMVVIAGRSSSRQSFKRKVGIGSSGHDLLGDLFIKVRISSIVAGCKFCSC